MTMTDKHISLPLYIKFLIVLTDWFVLIALVVLFPIVLFSQLGIVFEGNTDQTWIWTFSQLSILFLVGLIRAIRRIKIIESATTFTNGIAIGEISLDSKNSKHHKLLLRLSIELKADNSNSSIVKNYYLVSTNISKNKYDYTFVYNINHPEKVVLLNLLPKVVKNYIRRIESTIDNQPQ